MKVIFRTILLVLDVVFLSQCEKHETKPNENWVIGGKWIDTRDGHSYATVPIGDQIWLAENMAYLPSVNIITDGSEDEGRGSDFFYYVYDYNETDISAAKATSYYNQYGVLYNWTAANNACPDGWHLPTDREWMNMETYLGLGADEADSEGLRGVDEGSKIKSTWGWDFVIWKDKYGNGTNETGFTGLPGGSRFFIDDYVINGAGRFGFWWSASKGINSEGGIIIWSRILQYVDNKIIRSMAGEEEAMSVRCIKNR